MQYGDSNAYDPVAARLGQPQAPSQTDDNPNPLVAPPNPNPVATPSLSAAAQPLSQSFSFPPSTPAQVAYAAQPYQAPPVAPNTTGQIQAPRAVQTNAAQISPPGPQSQQQLLASDPIYHSQLGSFDKQNANWVAQDRINRANLDRNYNLAQVPYDPEHLQNSLLATLNDFASRGMASSSGYAQAEQQMNRQYADNNSRLTVPYQEAEGRLGIKGSDYANFYTQQQAARQLAYENAVQRRNTQLQTQAIGG